MTRPSPSPSSLSSAPLHAASAASAASASTSTSAPTVFALHASGFQGRQFARFAARAGDAFDVRFVEFLGEGASPPLPTPYTLAAEVDAFVATLRAAPAPVFVVAHSYGGLIALEAAAVLAASDDDDDRVRVRGLALFEPVIVGLALQGSPAAQREVAAIDTLMQLPFGAGDHDVDAAKRRAWLAGFIDWWNGPGAFARMPPKAQQPFIDTVVDAHRQAGCVPQMRLTPASLARVPAPTLILVGETSPHAARESAAIAAAALPHGRVDVVAGAGHMGPLTHADDVNERWLRFLTETEA